MQGAGVHRDVDGLAHGHLGVRVEAAHHSRGRALILRVSLVLVGRADVFGQFPGVLREHGRRLDLEVGDDLGAERLA